MKAANQAIVQKRIFSAKVVFISWLLYDPSASTIDERDKERARVADLQAQEMGKENRRDGRQDSVSVGF